MHVKLIASLVLAGVAVVFIIQNVGAVHVRFLLWSMSMPLSLFMFLLFAVGVTVGWLVQSFMLRAKRRR